MALFRRDKRTGSALVRRALRRNARALTLGTVLNSFYQVAETMVPVVIGMIVDRAISTGDVGSLVIWLLALAGVFLVITAAWRTGARMVENAVLEEGHRLRVEVVAKVLHPGGIRTDLNSGELLTVSTSDADQASLSLEIVPWVFGALVATTTAAISLLLIDVPLGLAVLIGTPVILACLQATGPLIARKVETAQASIARASGTATDLVTGLRPLRGIGAERAAAERYRRVSRTALRDTLRVANVMGVYESAATAVSALLAVAVSGGAGWLALRGQISIGELIAVVGLAQFIIEPLSSLASAPKTLAMARGSADRLALVLDADVLVSAGSTSPSALPAVTVKDVHYRSLDGLNLAISPGEFVCIVALSPQDGEALVDVLSGQIAPSSYRGSVLLDAVPIGETPLSDAREVMLVEPHNTDLFAGTVRSNIVAGLDRRHDHDPASVDDAVERGVAHSSSTDVVESHPSGLDHAVADRGASLSGGQRQRLALARALATSAPVLVLHDPTTAVDAVTEHAIAEGIAALRHSGNRSHTTVVVSSSPSLLSVAERVVVIDEGRVIAEGTHAELVDTDERYRSAVVR